MIANIQVLRAVAAYLVVGYHAQSVVLRVVPGSPEFMAGTAGVDIFFVVSGFIMVWTTLGRERTPGDFLRDRAVRIYPAYWVVTAVLVVLSLAGLRPAGLADWDLGNLLTSLLLLPDTRRDGLVAPLLGVGWTLVYEAWFYLLFAATLLAVDRRRAVLLLAAAIAGLAGLHPALGPRGEVLATYTSPLMLEFAMGMMLALAHARASAWPVAAMRRAGVLLVGVAVLAAPVAAAGLGARIALDPWLRVLCFGLPAAAVVAGALLLERAGIAARGAFVLGQGQASYALYLSHLLTLHVVARAAVPFAGAAGALFATALGIAGVAISGMVGTLFHRQVEAPLTRALRAAGPALRAAPRPAAPSPG